MGKESKDVEVTTDLEIDTSASDVRQSITISGHIPNLHDDPAKVRQLLDLLDLPSGTQVRVVTTAASVIVR